MILLREWIPQLTKREAAYFRTSATPEVEHWINIPWPWPNLNTLLVQESRSIRMVYRIPDTLQTTGDSSNGTDSGRTSPTLPVDTIVIETVYLVSKRTSTGKRSCTAVAERRWSCHKLHFTHISCRFSSYTHTILQMSLIPWFYKILDLQYFAAAAPRDNCTHSMAVHAPRTVKFNV